MVPLPARYELPELGIRVVSQFEGFPRTTLYIGPIQLETTPFVSSERRDAYDAAGS